ncbi:MAG: IS1380 family transposase [Streptosporangiaceae bacterium]
MLGAPDRSLTPAAGMLAVSELVDRLGVVQALDAGIGPVKARNRGLSGGQLLVSLAGAQLLGQDVLAGLDRVRADTAGRVLCAVPTPASTTAGSLARRFGPGQLGGVEDGLARLVARWLGLLPARVRSPLQLRPPTIDLDSTEVEVYGRAKNGVAYNYLGQRAGRPHLASWAEAGLPLAADLLAGDQDVRPRCADLLRRALKGLPAAVCARSRVRADAGYFTAELAHAADALGVDWAIAAKRNSAFWRELAAVPEGGWTRARGMPGAQVAAMDYAPAGWPPDAYTIVRRVKVDAADISGDPRSRRRRTIPAGQLALALGGELDHTYAVSFIVTNLPTSTPADLVAVEAWFRRRTDIEERFREAKLGAGLNHLPSGHAGVNAVWMWGALLAGAISVMLQTLTGISQTRGTARMARLRHELLRVPGRVISHAGATTLRLPPGHELLPQVLSRIRALPCEA